MLTSISQINRFWMFGLNILQKMFASMASIDSIDPSKK